MVSEKTISVADEVKNSIARVGINANDLSDLRDIAAYAIETEHDIKWALKVSNYVKLACEYSISHGVDLVKMDEQYWKTLKLEAPHLLDSYCLYIEKDRPKEQRFYKPRRKTLLKVVDKLQLLEDDELDELFIHMPARIGKLLSDDTDVLTSRGWKKHGSLKVGDYVVGLDGKFTRIIYVHPKNHTTHTVEMSDGTKIDCHFRHEWMVYDRSKQKTIITETQNLIDRVNVGGRNNLYLPVKPIFQGKNKYLELNPYVLGVWLGDGTNREAKITGDKKDFSIIEKIESLGYKRGATVVNKTTGALTTYIFALDKQLRKYGMCFRKETTEKHIPGIYLQSSVNQRLQLLAGLIDTDGCLVEKERRYQYTTCDETLKNDVKNLINSLGWRACEVEVDPRTSSSGIVGKRKYWVISFNPSFAIPCVLKRKQLNKFSNNHRLSIVSIEESEHKQGNCITVSNRDGMYLVTQNMIPTHNTQIITLGTSWHCARNTELSNLYCSYKEEAGSSFLDGLKEIWTDPTYLHKEVFPLARIVSTDAKNNTIDLERNKKYKSISGKGLTSGLNGLFDATGWLIADDVLEGIQDVLSPDILRRKQTIFDNNLMKRKKEKCKVIYNGTIWSLHDIFMNRMSFLENNPEARNIRWDVIKIPALDPETDESNFDYEYGVGFSTQYYRTERAKFEENEDMASWFSQCQQEPIERDGAVFNPEHMNFYNGILPENGLVRICAACDVALGGLDYLSCPVACIYEDGSCYIPSVVFDKNEKQITQPKIVEMFIKQNVGSAMFEANQGGEGYKDEIDRLLREKNKRININSKWADTQKRKQQRIFDNAGQIRQMYFLEDGIRDKDYRAFMNNVYSFTMLKNKHEDAPDSLSQLCDFINGSGSVVKVIKSPF